MSESSPTTTPAPTSTPSGEIAANAVATDPDPLYFEDYTAELRLEGGDYLVTEAEILEFGRRFDPQPFHTAESTSFRTANPRRAEPN